MKQAADTKARILEAGLQVFSARGYRGGTTKEIAARAGVAEVTLFRHFSTKEKLFQEILGSFSFLPMLRQMLPELEGKDYRDSLLIMALRFFEFLSERKNLVRIIHTEIYRSDRINRTFSNFINEAFGTLAAYFRAMRRQAGLREFRPEAAARVFMGMLISNFIIEEFLGGRKTRRERTQIVEELVDIFVKGTGNRR
ncbi:MAG: TetR/AcrR family transcriptional regulator [Syntrophales bacterium]|nr:TetR/AcrR family transcriptional regulator [Syntrophales bacterium]MDD5233977.1 TetR/AcrR family transcriptional regulator [Syntrophales bacterium]